MKKKYAHIDLPPDLQAFRANFMAATEVEGTLGGIITCYKVSGRYFIRTKSSLTGKRVKKDKRFQRTMHNAGILALAAQYVTPIYNALTDDWRCHDLYRRLVGVGVKLLHQDQGCTKEAVQQAVHAELERLGYRTAWPEWELPPNLQQWLEEEQSWVVNEKGQLVLTVLTANEYSPLLLQPSDSHFQTAPSVGAIHFRVITTLPKTVVQLPYRRTCLLLFSAIEWPLLGIS